MEHNLLAMLPLVFASILCPVLITLTALLALTACWTALAVPVPLELTAALTMVVLTNSNLFAQLEYALIALPTPVALVPLVLTAKLTVLA